MRMATTMRLTIHLAAAASQQSAKLTEALKKKFVRKIDNIEAIKSYVNYIPTLGGSTPNSGPKIRYPLTPLSDPSSPITGRTINMW